MTFLRGVSSCVLGIVGLYLQPPLPWPILFWALILTGAGWMIQGIRRARQQIRAVRESGGSQAKVAPSVVTASFSWEHRDAQGRLIASARGRKHKRTWRHYLRRLKPHG